MAWLKGGPHSSADAQALSTYLERAGFLAIVCESMTRATTELIRSVHVVLMDMNLPDGDGLSRCLELKADSKTKRVPVILMSECRDSTSDISQFISSGALAFLKKPFLTTDLIEIIDAIELTSPRDVLPHL